LTGARLAIITHLDRAAGHAPETSVPLWSQRYCEVDEISPNIGDPSAMTTAAKSIDCQEAWKVDPSLGFQQ
jgi:hypothetical protein